MITKQVHIQSQSFSLIPCQKYKIIRSGLVAELPRCQDSQANLDRIFQHRPSRRQATSGEPRVLPHIVQWIYPPRPNNPAYLRDVFPGTEIKWQFCPTSLASWVGWSFGKSADMHIDVSCWRGVSSWPSFEYVGWLSWVGI